MRSVRQVWLIRKRQCFSFKHNFSILNETLEFFDLVGLEGQCWFPRTQLSFSAVVAVNSP